MSQTKQDTQTIFHPQTYVTGVPYDVLARLRRDEGVVWVEEEAVLNAPAGPGFWLVLRHADVEQVMRTPKLFSSWLGTQIRNPPTDTDLGYVRQMMLNMDPPEHSRLRRLLHQTFTPTAVAALEEGIQRNAQMIVARVLGRAVSDTDKAFTCDFVRDIAADLPLLTLADLFGMPAEDRLLLFDWANRVIGYQDPDYATSAKFDVSQGSDMARQALAQRPQPDVQGNMPNPRTRAGMLDLYTYAHLLAEEKRRNPGDDIMSLLLAASDEAEGGTGTQVSIEEFENLFWLFAVAGNETLRNGIPGGMIALLKHPQAQTELRNNPALLPTAVDEMLRWWTPVMTFRRTATADCELAGKHIRTGDKVVVSFASANRDEHVFDDADAFDIHRKPNPHLSFGYGPHFCIGAHLARMQMRAIFGEVLAHMDEIEYAGEPSYLQSNFQRGVKNLPIRWTTLGRGRARMDAD
ncbi:MAG: cytochrome P450 [Chloroflexota bacterium]